MEMSDRIKSASIKIKSKLTEDFKIQGKDFKQNQGNTQSFENEPSLFKTDS